MPEKTENQLLLEHYSPEHRRTHTKSNGKAAIVGPKPLSPGQEMPPANAPQIYPGERIKSKLWRARNSSKERVRRHAGKEKFDETHVSFWGRVFGKHGYNVYETEPEEFHEVSSGRDHRNFYEFRRNRKGSYGDQQTKPSAFIRFAPGYDDVSHIQTNISFAAYIKRRGSTASCTQTLRRRPYDGCCDRFEKELRSNMTVNPIFAEDSMVEADLSVVWHRRPTRHRLYTIKEETETEEYDHALICLI